MEFLELDEEGSYGKTVDGTWHLTPLGLAQWTDEEGGLSGLMARNGPEPFLEVGCDLVTCYDYVRATEAMIAELERIGAVL